MPTPSEREKVPYSATTTALAGVSSDSVVIPQKACVSSDHLQSFQPTCRKAFRFRGVLAEVPEHREEVMAFVNEHCGDEGDRIDILVALQEALANAALHGCKDDPSKYIDCEVEADPSLVVITVRDPGPGFNLDVVDPEKYEVTKLTHGRGVCLMRTLMSDVSYTRNGSEVVLRKQIQTGTAPLG